MRTKVVAALALGIGITGLVGARGHKDVTAMMHRTPVLLELFTSEGCSSCPPADQLLETLDAKQPFAGADLIVLSEHVDYWNHDGWKDPFSSAAFSERQSEYARALGVDDVYTPQLVVDGSQQLVGSNGRAARSAVEKAQQAQKVPVELSQVTVEGGRVKAHVAFGALPAGHGEASVMLAWADDSDLSQVMRGENAGRVLRHVAVVRAFGKVGTAGSSGAFSQDVSLRLGSRPQSASRLIVFLQEQRSGRVLGVAQQKLGS